MKRVYLAIDEKRFFIGQLKRRGDFFVCDPREEHWLADFVIHDGIIHNPSTIYLLIKHFLDSYRLRGASSIVCCPYLSLYNETKKKFAFFQVVLCVSKAGIKIDKLLEKEIL